MITPTQAQINGDYFYGQKEDPFVKGYNLPAQEYLNRIERVKDYLHENNLDAFVVSSELGIYYLTGISCYPLERPFFMVIFNDERAPRLLVPRMEEDHFIDALNKLGLSSIETHTYAEHLTLEGHNWQDALPQLLQGINNLAIEPTLPAEKLAKLKAAHENTEGHTTSIHGITEKLRMIKSENEIAIMERSATYAVEMTQNLYDTAYKNVPLAQLFGLARDTQNNIFADSFAHGVNPDVLHTKTLAAAWPDPFSAMPHYIPNLNDPMNGGIFMAFSTTAGYFTELETKVEPETTTPEEEYYFNVMMKAREEALKLLGPGAKCSDIDKAARLVFENVGLGDNILHRTGHGMGLEHHEAPFLVLGDDTILEPGMIVSIEPGIYITGRSQETENASYLPIPGDVCDSIDNCPGAGGYRHSHTYLITEDSYKDLTPFATELNDLRQVQGGFMDKGYGYLIEGGLNFEEYETAREEHGDK